MFPKNRVALVLAVLLLVLIGLLIKKTRGSVLGAKKTPDYTIVFIGDSMTEYLGNFDELRADFAKYYAGKNFLLLNYGYSSTNILSVQDRIDKDSSHSGRLFQSINAIPFDYVVIESMANNPLSQFPLAEGLKKQTEALDKIVSSLSAKHPKSSIIFMTTVAPIRDRYGEGVVNLSTEERRKWADERIAYIKNHIAYAKAHNIPIIDGFDDSLGKDGSGNIDYINTNDFIHPSPTGIFFISSEIAKFFSQKKLIKN